MASSSNTQGAPSRSGEQAHTAHLPPSAVGTIGPIDLLGATQALATDPQPLTPGRRLGGRYELVEPIARGGYGKIWRARHVRIGREFAIKVLLDRGRAAQDPDALIHEARRVSALEHPNIVNMIDVGFVEPERPFAVMELLVGRPLRAQLDGSPIPWARARTWALQALAGLAFAHEAGVVHGDITPNNIFLDSKNHTTKLIDFGLAHGGAHASAETPGAAREVRGTPAYMSPEQLQGRRVGAPSDLYSFGCVLFEVLTGQAPYRGTQNEIVVAHLERKAPAHMFPDTVPPAVVEQVLACLRKSPADRPQSAQKLADALAGRSAGNSHASRQHVSRRHAWVAPIACAAAVVATIAGLIGVTAPPRFEARLQPTELHLPSVTATVQTPALAANLPVWERAVPRPPPRATTASRPKRQTRSAPVATRTLRTHPIGVPHVAAPSTPSGPQRQSIAHVDGPKNPFAEARPATTSP